ncbi:hypothetical protein OROMI_016628 [Orobanche minor]
MASTSADLTDKNTVLDISSGEATENPISGETPPIQNASATTTTENPRSGSSPPIHNVFATNTNPTSTTNIPASETTQKTILDLAKQISDNVLKYTPVEEGKRGTTNDPAKVNANDRGEGSSFPEFSQIENPLDNHMHEGSNKSYRDAFSREDDDTRLGTLDFSDLNPTAVFTKEECADVSEYYKFALIGKFTYGKPSNQVISQQLKSDGFGLCKVQFLNGKHVLINLTCKSLCDKLWMKREYIISGIPMRLFPWSPSFDFKHEPALVPVWFKVHSLPAQWFDVRSLRTIASLVGTLVKIDDCTRNRTRMNFVTTDTTESDCLITGPLCVDKTDNDPFSAGYLCSENQETVQGQGNVPDLADETPFDVIVSDANQDLCNQGSYDDLSSESNDDFDFETGGGSARDMEEFNDVLLNSSLTDGGFVGSPYTWYSDGVWQRLDRILISPEWYTTFPFLSIRHLPKYKSDHNSLLCQFSNIISKPKSSFRFQNMWVKHHLFLPTVKESWDLYSNSRGMLKLLEKLSRLKYTLKEWNKLEFGNIFDKIDEAQYAVDVAENNFDLDPNTLNLVHLKKMNANLTLTLSMEEVFWKQKSHVKWIVEGERNSKLFHTIVKNKRQKNFIHSIRENGHYINTPEEIKNSAISYFSDCFAENQPCLGEIDPLMMPKRVSNEHNNILCASPSFDEIRKCVFELDGDSIAGPDGFNAKFFQVCWDIVCWDVCDAVLDFFGGSPMPRDFTTTTITLIPKTDNPQTWKNFRPISLCNTTYKIIAKILSGRLAKILPTIINPAQSGFIKGRNITDNILTAHEITHDISQSTTNTIIKLDMEKAYDRINWNFIFQVMSSLGFSFVWINFIKSCISNCWFSILVNGESVGFFKSQRGIRQGDPLSPLIFVIAADYFSRSIGQMFTNNPLMYYKIKKKVKTTHLAYADDILIFLNASKKNLQILKKCIFHYETVSGQKINDHKSHFIMNNPTSQIANWVRIISGFNKADLPITYLGVPLWKGLLRRGIIANNLCYCCNDDENLPHLFIHGPVDKEVWKNDKRVDNIPFTPKRVCERVWDFLINIKVRGSLRRHFWKGAEAIATRVGIPTVPRLRYVLVPVRWLKPDIGWWKLNSDGAARGNPGMAAAGGIIRNHLSNPIIMFSEFIGERSNNYAELYVLWRGLEFCVDHNFLKVWVESDSKIAL